MTPGGDIARSTTVCITNRGSPGGKPANPSPLLVKGCGQNPSHDLVFGKENTGLNRKSKNFVRKRKKCFKKEYDVDRRGQKPDNYEIVS
jgi:hypothetical protein